MHVLSGQIPVSRRTKAAQKFADWLGLAGAIVILAVVAVVLWSILSHVNSPNNLGNTGPVNDDQLFPTRGRRR
jgi:hypothetical protein